MKDLLLCYENIKSNDNCLKRKGKVGVMIVAAHTMKQLKNDGTVKLNEPFTKAIAIYIANKLDANSLIKEEFKEQLVNSVIENDIKLVIDIHGASIERDFDVELGTLNNLSSDFSSIRCLEDSFHKNGVMNVNINAPFKGGGITQAIYANTDAEAIQIEINAKYRNIDDIDKIKKVCDSIIQYINQYLSY